MSTGGNRAVVLDAGRDIVQSAAGLITTGRLDANAGRDILLHAGDPAARSSAHGTRSRRSAAALSAGGNLVLNANGALGITGNVLAANATIAAKGVSLGSAATITTIGGTTQLAAGGVVTLAGVIDAGKRRHRHDR